MNAVDFWENQTSAQKVIEEYKILKAQTEDLEGVIATFEDAQVGYELSKEADDSSLLSEADEQLLIDEVGFEPSWRFHHIPIIAGTIETDLIDELLTVQGVVFLTLNGEMRMALDNAIGIHHVDTVWDFGYKCEGFSIAIIDT